MARWKLNRTSGAEIELLLTEGDQVTVGRALDSNFPLLSRVVSRNHCLLKAENNKLTVTDLQSANGVYVGPEKIRAQIPFELKDKDIIGIGWTDGCSTKDITDELYVFKVTKVESMPNRIKFELDNELEKIKREIVVIDDEIDDPPIPENVDNKAASPSKKLSDIANNNDLQNKENINHASNSKVNHQPRQSWAEESSPVLEIKRNLKRKIEEPPNTQIKEKPPVTMKRRIITLDEDVIAISDSDSDDDFIFPNKCNRDPTASSSKDVNDDNENDAVNQPPINKKDENNASNKPTIKINDRNNGFNKPPIKTNDKNNTVNQPPNNEKDANNASNNLPIKVNDRNNAVNQTPIILENGNSALNKHPIKMDDKNNTVNQPPINLEDGNSALNKPPIKMNDKNNIVNQYPINESDANNVSNKHKKPIKANDGNKTVEQLPINEKDRNNASNKPPIKANDGNNTVNQPPINLKGGNSALNKTSIKINDKNNTVNQPPINVKDENNTVKQPPINEKGGNNASNKPTIQANDGNNTLNKLPIKVNDGKNAFIQRPIKVNDENNAVNQPPINVNDGSNIVNQPPINLNNENNAFNQCLDNILVRNNVVNQPPIVNDKYDVADQPAIKEEIKEEKENGDLEYHNVKPEYPWDDDEPIQIDSDSDSESEQWLMRLSQSSPGKPFLKVKRESRPKQDESSYSQADDFAVDLDDEEDNEEYENDIISIPPEPPSENHVKEGNKVLDVNENNKIIHDAAATEANIAQADKIQMDEEDFLNDLITFKDPPPNKYVEKVVNDLVTQTCRDFEGRDLVDSSEKGLTATASTTTASATVASSVKVTDKHKTTQVIQPLKSSPEKRSSTLVERKHDRKHKRKCSKRHITISQKEERKKKLKEIAAKGKDSEKICQIASSSSSKDKHITNVKVTSTNRGAFLIDPVQVVKTTRRSPQKATKGNETPVESSAKEATETTKIEDLNVTKIVEPSTSKTKAVSEHDDTSSKRSKRRSESSYSKNRHSKQSKEDNKLSKTDSKSEKAESKKNKDENKHKSKHDSKKKSTDSASDSRKTMKEFKIPVKNVVPLSDNQSDLVSVKPISKVEPWPPKRVKKTVRFSNEPPKVHVFLIEEGNNMKKTSLAKNLLKVVRGPYSMEKEYLHLILRWNPHWLEEQINNIEPPPILKNNNRPMAIFHFFKTHKQYFEIIGDLVLMEIWENISQGHAHTRNNPGLPMRIAHFPPPPAPADPLMKTELFSFTLDVSVPNADVKKVPRAGDLLLVSYGRDNHKAMRFLYVYQVRPLPSPPKNVNNFFTISVHSCFTERMRTLKPGELITAVSLSYIQQELKLFEAMENLQGSPLLDMILRPDPRQFHRYDLNPAKWNSNYTATLNPSQLRAVAESVAAALGDRPCINMIQGPPGTGKSSVISAIVMSYFNDALRRRCSNRGKVLICATSNAAVDELVCRLLKIRQELDQPHRFKLVRVGRIESMHKTALDVSSQMLAKRDAARYKVEPINQGLEEEISCLEAKINRWRTQALEAKDAVRRAYCQQKVTQCVNRINLLKSGGGGELRGEQLLAVERRIIEGADIIVTTLSSAHNHKLRGLKQRIALCIVDEAGQAIEPETLIPLILDVTKMTLVGDPQQLPGYISSQRAKKHGLGESLFSRMTSCMEHWPAGSHNPVILLNQQYRMHPDIADYPNRAFYGSRIQNVIANQKPNLGIPPYLLLSISSGDKGQGSCGGNEVEAWGVARLVTSLVGLVRRAGQRMTPPSDLSLAVITPYNGHKELIKNKLKILQEPNTVPVEVNTVDSFQGQERDVVVVSLARSQGVGFLTDSGRMNVMLTRAKHALIVCLNPHAMQKNMQWRTLVEDAQRRHLFRVLPNKMCMNLPAGADRDEILQYVLNKGQGQPSSN